MLTLPQYKKYQTCNLPWLEKIPAHWNVVKIKYSTYVKARIGWQNLRSHEFVDEGFPCVTGTDFKNGKIDWDKCYRVTFKRYNLDPNIQLQEDDVLITKDGTIGKVAHINELPAKATLNSGIFVTRPIRSEYIGRFMYWVLNSDVFYAFFQFISNGSTINHLYQNSFVNFAFPVPPVEEQERIVDFLDRKTSEIDQAIAQKQRLIELLQEQKAILIDRAVTKGLNRKVQMRDSGIEWIGNIPAHWSVVRNRYLFREQNERSTDGSEVHLSMSQKFGLIPSDELTEKTLQSESYEGAKLCRKGDLVLNRLKAHLGVFSVAPCDGLISPDYSVFRIRYSKMIPEYFEQLFKTSHYILEFNKRVKGIVVGFYRLYTDAFYDISCICPPEEEQEEIRSWISEIQYEFKIVENSINSEIRKLMELKTVFISNAVTGKLKV
ncbi:restriction endonuclease subunit S [Cyanobacteria bacterium FACHB-63]|nr:restriction endonuclease subunit S [Cyanobacteria bacterium FACHB-63]